MNTDTVCIANLVAARKADGRKAILDKPWAVYVCGTGEIVIHVKGMNPRDYTGVKVCIMDGNDKPEDHFYKDLAEIMVEEHNLIMDMRKEGRTHDFK